MKQLTTQPAVPTMRSARPRIPRRRLFVALAILVAGCREIDPIGRRAPPLPSAPAASPTAPATPLVTGGWRNQLYCLRNQEDVDCFSIDAPANWLGGFSDSEFEPVVLTSEARWLGAWDASAVNGRLEVTLGGNGTGSTGAETGPATRSDTVGGLPAVRLDDRLRNDRQPWDDTWLTSVTVNRGRHAFKFSLEVCCTADLARATPYLDAMDRMLASVRFEDPPLADVSWGHQVIRSHIHPTNDASMRPPETWEMMWGVAHPAGWPVSAVDGGDGGWQITSPAGAGFEAGPLVIRVEPAPGMRPDEWEALPRFAPFGGLGATRLVDDTTAHGQRTLTLMWWPGGSFVRVIATMPDLPEGSPERRRYEGAVVRVTGESGVSWSHPTGYPGPGTPGG